MSGLKLIKTRIPDLLIFEPAVFGDARGYFVETYNKQEMESLGFFKDFVQDNESMSSRGVLRGLHYQTEHTQGKFVRVVTGEVYDVAVDIRHGSPTFGQYEGVLLSGENKKFFYMPEGFAHGFMVLSEKAIFTYKCTDYYDHKSEAGILWNDPDIGIQWPKIGCEPLLSAKDQLLSSFSQAVIPFVYKEKKQ